MQSRSRLAERRGFHGTQSEGRAAIREKVMAGVRVVIKLTLVDYQAGTILDPLLLLALKSPASNRINNGSTLASYPRQPPKSQE